MASASASESGRRSIATASPPTSRTSAATASSSCREPEASTSRAPSAPSATAQARPNEPEAPVTTTTCRARRRAKADCAASRGSSAPTLSRCSNAERLRRDRAIATTRTPQPSPSGQRQGNAMKVQRLPVIASRSPLMFSMPGMPPLTIRVLWAASQSGKVLHHVAAGLAPVFFHRDADATGPAVVDELRAERMIERLHVDADHLHLLARPAIRPPLCRGRASRHSTRRLSASCCGCRY